MKRRKNNEVTDKNVSTPKVYLRNGENLPYKNQYISRSKIQTGSRFDSSTLHFINGEPNESKTVWNFTMLPTKDLISFHEAFTFCIKARIKLVCKYSKSTTNAALGDDKTKTFFLAAPMEIGFNIASIFKQAQAVFNHVSTDTSSSQDLGGSHSLLNFYNTISNSFSASERFEKDAESYRIFPALSGNYNTQLRKNIESNTLTPDDDRYSFYYLKAMGFPFQGISDVHLNMLAETFHEFNQRHSNENIIPPMNRIDVSLTRDNSFNLLHLLQPENITAEQLAKDKLSRDECNMLLTFDHNLSDDDSTLKRKWTIQKAEIDIEQIQMVVRVLSLAGTSVSLDQRYLTSVFSAFNTVRYAVSTSTIQNFDIPIRDNNISHIYLAFVRNNDLNYKESNNMFVNNHYLIPKNLRRMRLWNNIDAPAHLYDNFDLNNLHLPYYDNSFHQYSEYLCDNFLIQEKNKFKFFCNALNDDANKSTLTKQRPEMAFICPINIIPLQKKMSRNGNYEYNINVGALSSSPLSLCLEFISTPESNYYLLVTYQSLHCATFSGKSSIDQTVKFMSKTLYK